MGCDGVRWEGRVRYLTVRYSAAVQWGDVPTWINSVVTFLALIFAAVAALTAKRLYDIESDRDRRVESERREQEQERRREQAAKVSAWYTWRLDQLGLFDGDGRGDGSGGGYGCGGHPGVAAVERYLWRPDSDDFNPNSFEYGALIRNASELPVYDVRIDFLRRSDLEDAPDLRMPVSCKVADLIPPGDAPVFVPVPGNILEAVPDRTQFVVAVSFVDAAGYSWRRNISGRLLQPAGQALA